MLGESAFGEDSAIISGDNEFDDAVEGQIDDMIIPHDRAEDAQIITSNGDDSKEQDVNGVDKDTSNSGNKLNNKGDHNEENDEDMDLEDDEFEDEDGDLDGKKKSKLEAGINNMFDLPEFTRKDKTLQEILEMMEDNAPIIPDAVIDYYLMKNGMNLQDLRIKRLLALATQKFISDIATDAYEYSRIRSSTAVYNANNGQTKARQLLMGQQQQQLAQQEQQNSQQGNENNSGNTNTTGVNYSANQQQTEQDKVVLTVNDLSSAVAEYGLNISKPDFYR